MASSRLEWYLLVVSVGLAVCPGAAGAAAKGPPLLNSKPRRQPRARYYPPQDLLDCAGANFSFGWTEFRRNVIAYMEAGYPVSPDLSAQARSILAKHEEQLVAASSKLPNVLMRVLPVERLRDVCVFGVATAMFIIFRHDLWGERLESISQMMGWVEWPLDFMESSSWPTLWRHVSLHLEAFRSRGDTSWSAQTGYFGDDAMLLPKPSVQEVQLGLQAWLRALGAGLPRPQPNRKLSTARAGLRLARAAARRRPLRILVLGHHIGSSMEPFSMLRAALHAGGRVNIKASFYGQRHPHESMMCAEFGYCDQNEALSAWFRRYENTWLGFYPWMPEHWDDVVASLAGIIRSSGFVRSMDLVVCGGPTWLGVMLRSLWDVPLLMYFAWPVTALVPPSFKRQLLGHVRALWAMSRPPVVFVVANWVLAAQFAWQMRVPVEVQRPHGIYINQTYAPIPASNGHARIMVTRIAQWASMSGIALFEMVYAFAEQERRRGNPFPFEFVFLSVRIRGVYNVEQRVKYADFAKFHACLFWPWDAMMMLFDELYTMTVPLILPSPRWMVQLMKHALTQTDLNWWHLRGTLRADLPNPTEVPYPLPFEPFVARDAGLPVISYWYELTDFAQFPHVVNFDSLPDLFSRVQQLDVPRVRAGMAAYNSATFRDSLKYYRTAASELLAAS